MSSLESQDFNQRPGGLEIDYLSPRRIFPRRTPELSWMIDDWWIERRVAIWDVRQHGQMQDYGKLQWQALEMANRWSITAVGKSPCAWMERTLTSTAMLHDFRSLQFGRAVFTDSNPDCGELERYLDWFPEGMEGFQRFSSAEYHQARMAVTFSAHWQRYLGRLIIRPPGDPLTSCVAFPSEHTTPDETTRRIVAELAHCRPCGAYHELLGPDAWKDAGGRDVCRKPLHCPHCHARYATRLVERVEQGPWKESRRQGRHLVLVRMAISSEDLRLNPRDEDHDRDLLEFDRWLRTSTDDYTADPGEETMIRNIDCNQEMSHTLTRIEVTAAGEFLKQLTTRCRESGMSGGMSFHAIGPRARNYLHELSVIGEVSHCDVGRFAEQFGIHGGQPMLNGCSIECVIFAAGHSAARLAIAGSSWKYDLLQVGARLNELALRRTYYGETPRGLRGTLAWQPLFLLSSVSFWSRWKVLKVLKFKSHHTFGTWRSLLPPDRHHRSRVQQNRRGSSSCPLKTGASYDPAVRLRRRIVEAKFSQKEIARIAGVSTAAVSRFINESYGSKQLLSKLSTAIASLEAQPSQPGHNERTVRFLDARSVAEWLSEIGQSQSWLASQLNWNRSKVSRILSGQTNWSQEFATSLSQLSESLQFHTGNRDCRRTRGIAVTSLRAETFAASAIAEPAE